MKSKYIYMAVTKDKYELPITIADTAEELGRMFGLTRSGISRAVNRYEKEKMKTRFRRVAIEPEEEE